MPSEITNEEIRSDWRELGFFYDQDEAKKVWRLVGSKSGLAQFSKLLYEYAAHPSSATMSEHVHFGPYMYLKIMTWASAGISKSDIRGTIVDLKRLAQLVDNQLASAKEGGVFLIREEFSPESVWALRFEIRDDSFDPATEDPELNKAN